MKIENLLYDKKGMSQSGMNVLAEEHTSLNTCLRISEEMSRNALQADEEIQSQDKTLKKNRDKLETILNKVPIINKVLSNINFHKYKQNIVLGLVIGFIVFFGLYLTY